MSTWVRSTFDVESWGPGFAQVGNIPANDTLLRVRFGWGASFVADTRESALNLQRLQMTFGLFTCDSDTPTADLPNPAESGDDPSPPVERYVWWESRQFTCTAWDSQSHFSFWKTTEPQEDVDSRGQVIANVESGDSLKLYALWGSMTSWTFQGEANVWFWTSVLYD